MTTTARGTFEVKLTPQPNAEGYPPLLGADRSRFYGNRAALGVRRHSRQEHLYRC